MAVRGEGTGVQYVRHTVTGLCVSPEGGGQRHKDLSVSLHPQAKCHRGGRGEREKGRERAGGEAEER